MNSECNNCSSCNSCDPCGGCKPACYKPYFNLQADPYNADYWLWEMGGENGKVKLPKFNETDTTLSSNYSNATLNYKAEKHNDVITGEQLGSLINLDDLRDVDAANPDACSLLVFNPGCGACPCSPDEERWKKYSIPEAGNCEIEPDSDGYYRVLVRTDCGCIKECRLPVVPSGMLTIDYMRDSVPDDPDFPWYYGAYNDTINLHLAENVPEYFGKYDLKITVNYGIQCCKSTVSPGVNFRSLVCPVIAGQSINVTTMSSILQSFAIYSETPQIPWGTTSMRGSFTFYVPKGKEASLHHEFRLRTVASGLAGYKYATNPLDGQKVPDDIAGQPDKMAYIGSRLNALQIIVEPTLGGSSNTNPVTDTIRTQLDAAVDEYPPLAG